MRKSFMRFILAIFLFFGINFNGLSQNPKRSEINLEQFIQQRTSIITEDQNQEDLYESLFQIHQNPLNINLVTADELAALHLLTQAQIQDFITYRTENGAFLSLYELQAVPMFNRQVIDALLPFVVLPNRFEIGNLQPTNLFFIIRADQTFEPQKGYSEPEIYQGKPTQRYLGDKQRIYTRFRMQTSKNFSAGFTAEKDAGEKGVDFMSFHGQIMNRGSWRNIVVGDYQLQMGQGLISSAGFAVGKGSEAVSTIRRGNVGIKPYTSSLEGGFYRGVAATYIHRNLQITPFVSINKNDATVQDDDETETTVSSILNNGFHRTDSEKLKKNQLLEQNYGLNVLFKKNTGQVGISGLLTNFNKTIERKPTYYNEFEFSGNQNHILSLHFSKFLANLNVFGEAARSKSGGIAVILGAMKPLSKRLDVSVLLRSYDKNYHSFYGNAFGENSRPINEQGIYSGVRYIIHKKLIFNAFVDFFKFKTPKYLVSEPSSGNDFMARVVYTPSKITSFSAQYFFENKQKNLPQVKPPVVVGTHRTVALLNAEHAFSKIFSIQSRVQMNDFQFETLEKSKGFMAMQDVNVDLKRWNFNARIAYFDTDNYDSRIYAYERDVLYAVSFPAYYRKGIRSYLVTRFDLASDLSLFCRIARTTLAEEYTSIGSGLDEIDGRIKTDIKVQLVWRK